MNQERDCSLWPMRRIWRRGYRLGRPSRGSKSFGVAWESENSIVVLTFTIQNIKHFQSNMLWRRILFVQILLLKNLLIWSHACRYRYRFVHKNQQKYDLRYLTFEVALSLWLIVAEENVKSPVDNQKRANLVCFCTPPRHTEFGAGGHPEGLDTAH